MILGRAGFGRLLSQAPTLREACAWWLSWSFALPYRAIASLTPRSWHPMTASVHVLGVQAIHVQPEAAETVDSVFELLTGERVAFEPLFSWERRSAARVLSAAGRASGFAGRLTWTGLQRSGLVEHYRRRGWLAARSLASTVGLDLAAALDLSEGRADRLPHPAASVRVVRGRLRLAVEG